MPEEWARLRNFRTYVFRCVLVQNYPFPPSSQNSRRGDRSSVAKKRGRTRISYRLSMILGKQVVFYTPFPLLCGDSRI